MRWDGRPQVPLFCRFSMVTGLALNPAARYFIAPPPWRHGARALECARF
jgi:hypothetical protein